MLLSIVHTKGGVGKSTSTLYLATAAYRYGITTHVLDTDPQGTAQQWAADATAAGEPLPFSVDYATARELTRPTGAELVIIDTPPGNAKVIDAAIDSADLVIVPTQASPADIKRAWPTLEVTAHRPTAILLTRVSLHRTLVAGVRAELEDEGVAVFTTPILDREHVKQAWAATPSDLNGYDDVLREIIHATTDEGMEGHHG